MGVFRDNKGVPKVCLIGEEGLQPGSENNKPTSRHTSAAGLGRSDKYVSSADNCVYCVLCVVLCGRKPTKVA